MNDDETVSTTSFAYEVGHLARCPRSGWHLVGIRDPESVAEHSHRVGVLAWMIATLEGADAHRAATLGLFHDVPETRSTDLHYIAKRHNATEPATETARTQAVGLPSALRDGYEAIIAEVDAKESLESICAKDADRLDCVLKAREYQENGWGESTLAPWIDNTIVGIRTTTGKTLADKALNLAPRDWWYGVMTSR